VEPRFGRLYAGAVLRPLAEQVAGVLGVRRGETVCDLMCDGGTLGVSLGAAVGAEGHVVLVDIDSELLRDAQRDVATTGCGVSTLVLVDDLSPLPEHACDRVASLCPQGFWEHGSLLDAADHALRPAGSAAMLVWDPAHPPLHEVAIRDALQSVLGMRSPFLTRCLAGVDMQPAPGWMAVTVHDVVRFDGIATYWAAMVTERAVANELSGAPDASLVAVRAACQRALERCTAADGTMRIPVSATLYCSG
jgi:predicted RNA methylase